MKNREPDPILPHRLKLTSPRFQHSLTGWIRKFIDELPRGNNARQIEAERFEKQSASLYALAGFIGEQPVDDGRLFALAQVAGSQPGEGGWIHRQNFTPTRSQRRIFYQQGIGGASVAPESILMQLVLAGLADTLQDHVRHAQQLEHERSKADAASRAAEAKVELLAEAEAERDRLRREVEATEQQISKLQQRAVDLEGFVAAAGDSGAPRRVKVEGETGVYQSSTREHGLVYEVGFPDDQGKQRWKVLGPEASIEDARQVRARLAGQPHDPGDGGDGDQEQDDTAPQDAGDGIETNTERSSAATC